MGLPAIELKNVEKRFGNQSALFAVNLNLAPGHFYALMGKNGAGKSTLMRILMRQERLTNGYVAILGKSVESDSSDFNQKVGYVSEAIEFQLPRSLKSFFHLYGQAFPRWDADLFNSILDRLQIEQKREFRTLSRGQKMQVATAAAMAIRPQVLCLDEVTSVLDPDARAYLMDLLAKFVKAGGTVLMASNILSEVQNHADHLILLHEGTVRLNLPVAAIHEQYRKLRRTTQESHAIFSDPSCAEVSVNADGSLSYIIPAIKASLVPPNFFDQRRITAEEMFVYLTRSSAL